MATKTLTIPDTTIGKKVVMAASGVVLFGFVIGHMLGNLQVYLGQKPFNEYAHFLHTTPTLLWGTRVVLLLAVVAHIVTALQLAQKNRGARPRRYRVKKSVASTYAGRTMVWSGPILLAYIFYHLAHLTVGYTAGLGYDHNALDPNGLRDAYGAVVTSFSVPWCVGIYVVAQVMLGIHLYHGAWSLFQSLGINHKRYNETLRSAASAIALATVAGFLSVPIGVYVGWVA
jgi:succinate dehydrogenase / fumarate reductase cytochrome b subunit